MNEVDLYIFTRKSSKVVIADAKGAGLPSVI